MDDKVRVALQLLEELATQPDRVIKRDVLEAYSKGFDPDKSRGWKGSPIPLDQTVELEFGWKVTLSIEDQPFGLARHFSMSSPVAGKAPVPEAVCWVMEALGYTRKLEECCVYLETYEAGRTAVNVLEPIDPTASMRKKDA
jgi:hypothetical protein